MGNLVDTSKAKYIKDILGKFFKGNIDIVKFMMKEHKLNENDLLNEQILKDKIDKLKGLIKDVSKKHIKDDYEYSYNEIRMERVIKRIPVYEYYSGQEKIDKNLYDKYLIQNSRIQSDIKIFEEIIKGLEEWNGMFSGYKDFSNAKIWPKGVLKDFIYYCKDNKNIQNWIEGGIDENKDKILTKAKEIKPNFEKINQKKLPDINEASFIKELKGYSKPNKKNKT